jgi:heptosyltransferase II
LWKLVRVLVRAPNHLGDFVMALPALHAAAPTVVMLPHWLEPLARLAGFQTLPFDRGNRGFMNAVRALRQGRFDQGILLTPSFSSALMLRLGGVPKRRGTDTDRRSFLLTDPVDRELLAHHHRSVLYMLLATGDLPGERPVPQLPINDVARLRFRDLIGTTDPLIGIVPGSNAPSRTWPGDRFAEVADQLSRDGRVVVFGGEGERERTRQVAGDVAIDLGGRTTLPLLAAGLAECELVISNDTGPLHLAAAVGARTISLWGAGNPAETGPPAGHAVLRDTRLPCLECVRNRCPRRGKGYILPDAYNECLHLIESDAVIAAARAPFHFRS